MAEPIAVRVTRYRCPTCPRTHASKARAREHHARCWRNPDAHGCKTCKHYEGGYDFGPDEGCEAGVSLAGSETCPTCGGFGDVIQMPGGGASECPTCDGYGGTDGPPRKPGPITGCPSWEPIPAEEL